MNRSEHRTNPAFLLSMVVEIQTHILSLSWHTRSPRVSDDHTARLRPKNQYICPESPSIINATYNDGHRVRPRMFQANTVAHRATGRSLYKYIFHSFTLVPLLRQSPSILRQPLFFLSHAVLLEYVVVDFISCNGSISVQDPMLNVFRSRQINGSKVPHII